MSMLPSKLQPWFDARKRFKLSHAHIQMARELGLNPKKFGSLDNHQQQPWKAPLPEFIEDCYEKRFKRSQPEQVRTLEQLIKDDEAKRKARKAAKAEKANQQAEQQQEGLCCSPQTKHEC